MLVKTEVAICVRMQTKGWMICCRCIRKTMLLLASDSLPKHQREEAGATLTLLYVGGSVSLSCFPHSDSGGIIDLFFSFIYFKRPVSNTCLRDVMVIITRDHEVLRKKTRGMFALLSAQHTNTISAYIKSSPTDLSFILTLSSAE